MRQFCGMKKVYTLFLIVIFSVAFRGMMFEPLAAADPQYSVNYNASFDNDNIDVGYSGDHDYADRISFGSDIETLTDYTFAFWILNGVVRYDLSYDHTFIVNGDMDMEAIFSDNIKFAVAFMDSNGSKLELQYVDSGNDAIPPSIFPDKPGFLVNTGFEWSDSYQGIMEHKVLYLQYTIDETAQYDITVNGGSGDGTYTYNDVVSVVADEAPESEVFSHWTEDGETVSYQETYLFSAFEDRTLTAEYANEATAAMPLITMSDDLAIRTDYATYKGQFSFDKESYELIEYGFLRSDTEASPEHSMQDVTRYRGVKYHGPTKEFIMSFADQAVYQRPYLVLEDNSEVLHYYYGNVVETTNYDINLTANHASAVVDAVQSPPYFEGDYVDITASSVSGYNFLHWYDLDSGEILTTTQNPTLTMDRNYNIEARYQDENILFDYDFSELTTLPNNLTYSKSYSGGDILFNNCEDWETNGDYLRIGFSPATSGSVTLTIVYTGYNLESGWLSGKYFDWSYYKGGYTYSDGDTDLENGTHTITGTVDSGVNWFKMEFGGSNYDPGYVKILSIKAEYN